jgi:mono/diheme cytochrome c family protein
MDELVAAAAAALEAPESLVMRSARARAQADGLEVEAVLAAWAGGEPAASPSGPAPAEEPAAAEELPVAEDAGGPAEPPAEAAPAAGPADELRPPRFEPEEEAAAAGAIPRWLAAALVIIPVVALLYALFLPNGPNCGDAGALAIDPISGEAVNCDLSPYGVDIVDYFAIGMAEYAGCTSCHGENGGGSGNFPTFVGGSLLTTFPDGQCADQVEWIAVGTAGWPGATYGATGKPVGGSGALMPAFGGTLTDVELRSVALYERVQFGGQALEAALADCGLEGPEAAVE